MIAESVKPPPRVWQETLEGVLEAIVHWEQPERVAADIGALVERL
jgi:hypothetical protein